MPTLMHQRFDARARTAAERSFGVTVKLRSGSDESAEFTAILDRREDESIELETGLAIKYRRRSYIVKASDCVINAVAVVPARGMYILEGSDAFEILPTPGSPSAELLPDGNRYLLHTKEVS